MAKLKVGDGPFIGTNIGIIQKLFGTSVVPNVHGTYEIKENKWVAFIYLAKQQPNGEWTRHPKTPSVKWLNKPNSDNSEFIRECDEKYFRQLFTDPTAEYAVFTKTDRNRCFFYGIFKLKEIKDDYTECVFKRINSELKIEEWK